MSTTDLRLDAATPLSEGPPKMTLWQALQTAVGERRSRTGMLVLDRFESTEHTVHTAPKGCSSR
jgi:hypothetical protein